VSWITTVIIALEFILTTVAGFPWLDDVVAAQADLHGRICVGRFYGFETVFYSVNFPCQIRDTLVHRFD
jgi:hypothetical protein